MSLTASGDPVFNIELSQARDILNDAFFKASQLSGFGFMLSSVGAVFSAIFLFVGK